MATKVWSDLDEVQISRLTGHLYLHNKYIGVPPTQYRRVHNINITGGRVFYDGYEYKGGKWRRTIMAFLVGLWCKHKGNTA